MIRFIIHGSLKQLLLFQKRRENIKLVLLVPLFAEHLRNLEELEQFE